LYVGVTSDLRRRIHEHTQHLTGSFTQRYNVDRLVHVETFEDPTDAIAREKQLKVMSRARKITLVERDNPTWRDLSSEI
jgi:putative endonuclease